MAISRPMRIPEDLHEKGEELALKATVKFKKITTKKEILIEAIEIGLKEIERKLAKK